MDEKTLQIIDLMLKDQARVCANQDFILYRIEGDQSKPADIRKDARSRAMSEDFNRMVMKVRELAS